MRRRRHSRSNCPEDSEHQAACARHPEGARHLSWHISVADLRTTVSSEPDHSNIHYKLHDLLAARCPLSHCNLRLAMFDMLTIHAHQPHTTNAVQRPVTWFDMRLHLHHALFDDMCRKLDERCGCGKRTFNGLTNVSTPPGTSTSFSMFRACLEVPTMLGRWRAWASTT